MTGRLRVLFAATHRRVLGLARTLDPFETAPGEGLPEGEDHLAVIAGSAYYRQPHRMMAGIWRLAIGERTVAVWLPDLDDSLLERVVWGPPVTLCAPQQSLSHLAVVSAVGGTRIDFYDVSGRRSLLTFTPADMRYDDVVSALRHTGLRVEVDDSWPRRVLRA